MIADTWTVGVFFSPSGHLAGCVIPCEVRGSRNSRLFANNATVIADACSNVPVSVFSQHTSPMHQERFAIAELLMRNPDAHALMLIKAEAHGTAIDEWQCRVDQHLSTSTLDGLIVDRLESPDVVALSIRAAGGYLADLDGLTQSLQVSESKHTFGASLLEWATRSGNSVVEIPLTLFGATSVANERHLTGETQQKETFGQRVEKICINGASVSVIVPTWNCAGYLTACLNSLRRQTVAAEIIVVNDASTDETTAVLESFGDQITVIRHDRQRGANAARNTGIAAASGDFIAFADADNEYSPQWIEFLLNAILSDSTSALAYCGYTKHGIDGVRVENRSALWDLETLWFGNYIDMSSIVRRSAMPTQGLHEGFRPFDDWRLWLNLAQRGWHGKWVPEQLFVKHIRNASKTEQSMLNLAERARDIAQIRREFAGLAGLDKPISVIIPACGSEDLTSRCLSHLGDYCGVPFYVIYVDNGSPLETLDTVVRSADDAGIALRVIRNLENRGFTHAVNQGIEATSDANVLLLNNDCFVGPGCIENLARELRFNDRVAAAGPLTCDNGKQSLRRDERRAQLQLPPGFLEELEDPVQFSFRLSQKRRSLSEPVLSFFCALLSGEALSRHGGLDPKFASGLGADDEWCFRLRARGWDVRVVVNAYAAHLHRSSFDRLKIDRDSLQQGAQELLHNVLATGEYRV
jgi:GT2 family glycosyltransferase